MKMDWIQKEILKELEKAETKFPNWPSDPIHAGAIVNEESGELTRACLQVIYEHGDVSKMHKEAVHTATMAIRFLKNFEYMKPPL